MYMMQTAGGTAGHRFEINSDGDVQARIPRSILLTLGDVALSIQPTDSTIHYGFRSGPMHTNYC